MNDELMVAARHLENAAEEVLQLIREGWLEEQSAFVKMEKTSLNKKAVEGYHQLRSLNEESVAKLTKAIQNWKEVKKGSWALV